MSPRPKFLVYQETDAQGPSDIRFATAGLGLKYSFVQPPPPPPPPPPPAVAQKPAPPPVKKKIVLRSVHFDFNKANIRPDAVPVLNEAVNVLKDEGTVGVIVAGHTDSIGSDAYNMKLSRRRADAVREYLISHGIPAKRIRVEAFGKRNPVASNDTADGRAQNRRVELNLD
jgi:OOP family OmpA-OmpF porin